ncbi:MAG: hypothetical protein WBE72_25780 [Terracidiphilus sp.]
MKRRTLLLAATSLVLSCSLSFAAPENGYWQPASSSAAAITGEIAISDSKVTINYAGFTIAQIRKLSAAEVSLAFDADVNAGGSGNLYRLNVPAAKRFVGHNTLCGSEDTQWMATYVEGRTLQVAFFSGEDMPVFTIDALANSRALCGTFSYVR